MQTFDVSPIFRTSQAFDRVFDNMSTAIGFDHRGFPEYDLLKVDDNHYRITLAVPGYRQDEISVETNQNTLWVRGARGVDPNHNQYLYQGLKERQFERSFRLPEHVRVSGAKLDAGLLDIELVREIPEELQPRRIEISTGGEPQATAAITDQRAEAA